MSLSRDTMPHTSGHWKLCDFVPKLQGDDDTDWVTWNRAFIMGITAIDPRFKEIIDGTLRSPEIHLNGCSSVGFLSADETRSPYDMVEEETTTPLATSIDTSRTFTQLNAMGSVLLRMTLGPVPMGLVSHMPDLKAAYHALSCEYGRYNDPCTKWMCNEWKAALADLLVDHELNLETIFDVFIKAIRDHDRVEDFLHSLQFDHSSMEMVYRQFLQHLPFSEF